jgi:hypothetical protein
MYQEERSIFWDVKMSVILSKKLYMYVCPIPNGFRDRAISLYSPQIVDKKEILRTVPNTCIHCSSNKVGTVYLVQHIFENSADNMNALCNSCEDMACSKSECIFTCLYEGDNIHSSIPETVRNWIPTRYTFLFPMTDTMTSQNTDLSF